MSNLTDEERHLITYAMANERGCGLDGCPPEKCSIAATARAQRKLLTEYDAQAVRIAELEKLLERQHTAVNNAPALRPCLSANPTVSPPCDAPRLSLTPILRSSGGSG
jgi:hypothetical protein